MSHFKSLRVRLTLLFAALTVIPLVVVGALIARQGFSTLQDQSVDLQTRVAQQTSVSLSSFFQERENELFVLTDVYGLTYLDENTQRELLLILLSKQPAYYEVALLDNTGQELIHLTRGEIITTDDLANRADNPTFRAALETETIGYSTVYFNENARDRLITMAVPISNLITGTVGHVLLAEIRFQNVSDTVLRNLELQNREDVYVVDNNGIVVAHRNPNFVLRETTFDVPEANGRTTGLGGGDVILARSDIQVENLDLLVVAETNYEHATALASNLTRLSTIITIVSLLISGAIVVFSVNQVIKPITRIAKVAEAIQKGDLSAQADERGSNELSTLGRAFNAMTAQQQRILDGLRENVEQLEKAKEERENLIKDLRFAKRMADENSRLKSEFLATMSHELRTPMNAIEGFTGIMLKRMGGVNFNDKVERYLYKIQSNSQRLLHLINDFLDLSRIESGRMEFANLPITPAQMVDKWKQGLDVLAESKNISFEVVIDPNFPEVIYGDEEALSKITTNLLGNAFKFTSEGKIQLTLEQVDHNMCIKVVDTGIGIPPHAREFIFDEFRQVDQSSKRVYGGTGLGLAIVQKLARGMNGTVTLDSEVGKGSTFTVLIPLQTEQVYA
ncbi:MAG: HAMP domain-containing protein [Anaerolineae bacterium]|nr:HAMP domain-containing protein [Anaerolineae bacterium]